MDPELLEFGSAVSRRLRFFDFVCRGSVRLCPAHAAGSGDRAATLEVCLATPDDKLQHVSALLAARGFHRHDVGPITASLHTRSPLPALTLEIGGPAADRAQE